MLLETEMISAETLLAILGVIAGIVAGAFGVIKIVAARKDKFNGRKDTKRLDTQEVNRITRADTRLDEIEKSIAALTQIAKEIRSVVDAGDGKGGKLIYGNPILQESIAKDLHEITRLLSALVSLIDKK